MSYCALPRSRLHSYQMKHSPYSHSFDEDLFPKKPPRRAPSLWKWLLVIGLGLFFVYRSTLPVVRLQSEPPPQFIGPTSGERAGQEKPEERIALAYWKVAVRSIQSEYSSRKTLPPVPPPEFRINPKSAELSGYSSAERNLYWRRLRDVWTRPEIWQVSYGWNTDWFTNALFNFEQFLGQSMQQFVDSVAFWRGHLDRANMN